MDPQIAIDMSREAVRTCLLVGGPILGIVLILGLGISLLQAMTQLHDHAIAFVPKILLLLVLIGVSLPWLSEQMLDFTRQSLETPGMGSWSVVPVARPPRTSPAGSTAPVSFSRVAQLPSSTGGTDKPTKSLRAPEVEQDPSSRESRESIAPESNERPYWMSPFRLPHYQSLPTEHEDLEG